MKVYEFAVELERVLRAIRDGEDTLNAATTLAHAFAAALAARTPAGPEGDPA